MSTEPKSILASWKEELRNRPRLRRALIAAGVFAGLAFAAVVWLVFPYLQAWGDIGAGPENAPSRLYALPHELAVGDEISPGDLAQELEALSYREIEGEGLPAGRYRVADDSLLVRLRRRMTPSGAAPTQTLWVRFDDETISSLQLEGAPVAKAALEAPVLATYYEDEQREKWPVEVRQLPEHVVQAVLAAEDAAFYWHPGVSPTGIARAALSNLRHGGVTQGGSTLTQQLVKNVFLSQERTLFRKVREAVIAIAVEAQHSKRQILQGYFNGIYLGGSGGIQFYGLGAAARAYFGKDPTELTLEESATLAGMIKAPAAYSPLRNPEKSRKRRDEVLRRMAELRLIDEARLQAALATPLETSPMKLGVPRARHFADAMAREARERFGLPRLGNRGVHFFATLSLLDQGFAEEAARQELDRLDRRGKRGGDPLEVALISVEPKSGAILAYVGGRDFERSEFDRVAMAKRQAGSCFKPIVLVAALEAGKASPSTPLKDEPLSFKAGGKIWTPKNSDGEFRGIVTARTAVEKSINIPLIRLGMLVGLDKVAATAHRLGIEQKLDPVPALALGSSDVTPREMATVYATLASGGIRPVLHGIQSALSPKGQPLQEPKPKKPERVITPQVAFITTSVLEGVVERGTAGAVRRYGIPGPLAGKTGTTNEARDSWFAGYRPDRVTVVWVGRDNPQATTLSGARAALPVWGRYMRASLPTTPGPKFEEPPGLDHATVCRESGLRARSLCPTVRDVFLHGQAPTTYCQLDHEPKLMEAQHDFGTRFGEWLKKKLGGILGGEEEKKAPEKEEEEPPPPGDGE